MRFKRVGALVASRSKRVILFCVLVILEGGGCETEVVLRSACFDLVGVFGVAALVGFFVCA